MAITTRYFSTSGAGDADGTSWANRAALLDGSGYWSTVLTGFDFTNDTLICRIGPGTYTVAQNLLSALFAVAPNAVGYLFFHGCDSSGNLLTPVDPDWKSTQPAWSTTGIPLIDFGAYYCFLANFSPLHINFTGSRSGYVILALSGPQWCQFFTTSSGTIGYVAGLQYLPAVNCVFSAEGASAYTKVVQSDTLMSNCRIIGPGASVGSGNRHGVTDQVGYRQINCTIVGVGGSGIYCAATNAVRQFVIDSCTIAHCGGTGIDLSNTASPVTATSQITNCMITGCGGYGINASSQISVIVKDCRLRDNTSGNLAGLGNYPTDLNNYITDSDDATEYVNTSTGDYRIKNTATNVWNKGYGAGDEPPSSSGGGGGPHYGDRSGGKQ
jgi:hypothetical protein